MYVKPTLEKFGTFRELTMVGWSGASDNVFVLGPNASGNNCWIEGNRVICPISS